jgi:hypothetical protein
MIADAMTKPLMGAQFTKLSNELMGSSCEEWMFCCESRIDNRDDKIVSERKWWEEILEHYITRCDETCCYFNGYLLLSTEKKHLIRYKYAELLIGCHAIRLFRLIASSHVFFRRLAYLRLKLCCVFLFAHHNLY